MKWSCLRTYLVVVATVGLVAGLTWAQDSTPKKGKGKAVADAKAGTDAKGKAPGRGDRGPRNFDDQTVGAIPTGWKAAETNGKGTPGKWEVIADPTAPSAPNVVALTKTQNPVNTFNLLMNEGRKMRDLDLEVKVKPISGANDQGGGPLWRAIDPNNYYVARWNPKEGNFRLYVVKAGKRTRVGESVDVKEADAKAWHTIKVNHTADRILVSFDGKQVIDATDTTFAEAGAVGLFTHGDSATAFDDFQVQAVRGPGTSSTGPDAGKAPADEAKAKGKKKTTSP